MDAFRFVAKVSPTKLFFQSLMAMRSMTDSPSCFFTNGSIKLRAIIDDTFALLIMDSWAWSSDPSFYTSAGFAVRCDSWEWMSRFPPSFMLDDRPLYFYIKRGSKNVCCLAGFGDDSRVERFGFRLGEFFRLAADDNSPDLEVGDLSFHLRSECLREVLTSFASRFDCVLMVVYEKSVAWLTASGELRYREERNEYRTEGVASGDGYYSLVEWKGKDTLLEATEIADMVLIHTVADPRCRDWIAFKFMVDEDNHFRYAMRGLAHPFG